MPSLLPYPLDGIFNLCTKSEVFSFTNPKSKRWSRDPDHAPFGSSLSSFRVSIVLAMVNLPNLKRLASTCLTLEKVSQNYKRRSRKLDRGPFLNTDPDRSKNVTDCCLSPKKIMNIHLQLFEIILFTVHTPLDLPLPRSCGVQPVGVSINCRY